MGYVLKLEAMTKNKMRYLKCFHACKALQIQTTMTVESTKGCSL